MHKQRAATANARRGIRKDFKMVIHRESRTSFSYYDQAHQRVTHDAAKSLVRDMTQAIVPSMVSGSSERVGPRSCSGYAPRKGEVSRTASSASPISSFEPYAVNKW